MESAAHGSLRGDQSPLGEREFSIGLCCLALVVLARSETRLEQSARRLRSSERIETNPVIAAMRKYS